MPLPSYHVWDIFAEFVRTELSVGGPDCQLKLLVSLGEHHVDPHDDPLVKRVWLNGCYAAHHCVPSGFAVWTHFPNPVVLATSGYEQERLYKWLDENWKALPVRPEMRSHRMIEKRWACLIDFAAYAVEERWKTGSYDEIWKDSIGSVKYYNRYMAIKYLELLRMTARPDLILTDMRAKHGWSPRIMLGLLFPHVASVIADREDNSDYAIELTEDYASEALDILKSEYNIEISYFQLQVLSCNAREASKGTFYPGAGHDEEMDYIRLAEGKFDMLPIWDRRENMFHHSLLGEKNDWFGIRKEKYLEAKEKWNGLYD